MEAPRLIIRLIICMGHNANHKTLVVEMIFQICECRSTNSEYVDKKADKLLLLFHRQGLVPSTYRSPPVARHRSSR